MANLEALLDDRPDSPATSYRILPSRTTAALVVAVLLVAAVAWVFTVRDAISMSGMINGLGQVGHRMPNEMGAAAFLQMWAVMMIAMMAPAVIPAALAHRLVLRHRNESAVSSAAFVVGFLAVWALVGILYFVPFLAFRGLTADAAGAWWLPVVAGVTLVLAGGYQFTRQKAHCQQTCCTPVTTVLRHDAGKGPASALRTGVAHGIHCLGCCWALMAVLLVVGLMNLAWMVGLSLLFVVEKHAARALVVGRVIGAGLIVVGVAVMASPALLQAVSGAGG
ncbi:MAG TPA: DUF2182 domain-containing protein [Egibacteraceae bacterium]|jgi:predicted metal-binding membrane protein|nr:DUF2182 domain-containing protein [Egibacteraceae bacterium]